MHVVKGPHRGAIGVDAGSLVGIDDFLAGDIKDIQVSSGVGEEGEVADDVGKGGLDDVVILEL